MGSSFPFCGHRFRKACVGVGCLRAGQAGPGGRMVRVENPEVGQGQRLLGERGLGGGWLLQEGRGRGDPFL